MHKSIEDCCCIQSEEENALVLRQLRVVAAFATGLIVKCQNYTKCSNLIRIDSLEHLARMIKHLPRETRKEQRDLPWISWSLKAYEVVRPYNCGGNPAPCSRWIDSKVFEKMIRVVCDACYNAVMQNDAFCILVHAWNYGGYALSSKRDDWRLVHQRCDLCFEPACRRALHLCPRCYGQFCFKCWVDINIRPAAPCKDCLIRQEFEGFKDAVEASIDHRISCLAGIIAAYGRGVVVECMASNCCKELAFEHLFEFEEEYRNARAQFESFDNQKAPIMKCYATRTSTRPTALLYGRKCRVFCIECCKAGVVTRCSTCYGNCDNFDEYDLCARRQHKTCSLCQEQVRRFKEKSRCQRCNAHCCDTCLLCPGLCRRCVTCEWLAKMLLPHIGHHQDVVACIVSYTRWLLITRNDVAWLRTLPLIKIMRHSSWLDERREEERLQGQTKWWWVTKKMKKRKRKRNRRSARNLDASSPWSMDQERRWWEEWNRPYLWDLDYLDFKWNRHHRDFDSVYWEMNGALMNVQRI